VENLPRVKEPDAIGTWLATTARNVSLNELRRSGRQAVPVDTSDRDIVDVRTAPPETGLIVTERDHALWAALGSMAGNCQQLLRALAADPPPTYAEVAAALGMPVGSIGPTRARCLEKLRQMIAADDHQQDLLGSP
jgi:RNA polymerase sigma factor (sigma-70 family)